jgi:formyl-CoA transferase
LAKIAVADIVDRLNSVGVPVGPIQNVAQALSSDQAKAREMVISVDCPDVQGGQVRLLGNPLRFSRTPVQYRMAPPHFGQHTDEILAELNDPKDA